MISGSLAFENTILKWVSDHRKHHNLSDTKDDPYSITEGFWHAHIGWIIKNTPEEQSKIKSVRDLESKSAIKFQNKYYFHIAIIVGFILPLIVGLTYNRPLVLWARATLVHHVFLLIPFATTLVKDHMITNHRHVILGLCLYLLLGKVIIIIINSNGIIEMELNGFLLIQKSNYFHLLV